MWAGTPNIEKPTTSLRVEYQFSGELLVVASYYLSGEEYPFFLGSTASVSDIVLAAGRIAATLTYSASIRAENTQKSAPTTVGPTVPSAHQTKREQLDELSEGMDDLDELLLRLRERPEWISKGISNSPSLTSRTAEDQNAQPDGGEEVRCVVCGSTPIQGPTLSYDGWKGKLMFCEPCIQRTQEAIRDDKTLLEVIASDLSNQHSRPRRR